MKRNGKVFLFHLFAYNIENHGYVGIALDDSSDLLHLNFKIACPWRYQVNGCQRSKTFTRKIEVKTRQGGRRKKERKKKE